MTTISFGGSTASVRAQLREETPTKNTTRAAAASGTIAIGVGWRGGTREILYQHQRVDIERGGIERRDDRLRPVRIVMRFPQVPFIGQIEPLALAIRQDAHLRPVRIASVDV